MSDPLGIMPPKPDLHSALAAAEQPRVKMMEISATLPTGRPVAIAVPEDIGALEALAFVGWVGQELANRIVARPKSRILVPR